MKAISGKLRSLFALLSVAVFATGCASVAVSDDSIQEKTARSLGLEKSAFTISDRANSGQTTTYTVKTTSGRTYSCYMTGGVYILGTVQSDAVCSELGNATAQKGACNALLKAAGKC